MDNLPIPDACALSSSQALTSLIKQQILQNNNWISFTDYMQLVLYTPEYGYYASNSQKFGLNGDFITAPELSSLFGQTLAK